MSDQQPLVPVMSVKKKCSLKNEIKEELLAEQVSPRKTSSAEHFLMPPPTHLTSLLSAALAAKRSSTSQIANFEPLPLWINPCQLMMGRLKSNPILALIANRSLPSPPGLGHFFRPSPNLLTSPLAAAGEAVQGFPDLSSLLLLQNHILAMITRKVRFLKTNCGPGA
jgi:hypothetical protein